MESSTKDRAMHEIEPLPPSPAQNRPLPLPFAAACSSFDQLFAKPPSPSQQLAAPSSRYSQCPPSPSPTRNSLPPLRSNSQPLQNCDIAPSSRSTQPIRSSQPPPKKM
ncbi:hypothetical protein I3843_16G045300 [Carya illinoinensis]|nr:hypothetical protein I3760_16G044200 [Carya illinoinensis]KAG7941475.1 hypothetical protein I3843_16G045300 [Carya illinoinensis]